MGSRVRSQLAACRVRRAATACPRRSPSRATRVQRAHQVTRRSDRPRACRSSWAMDRAAQLAGDRRGGTGVHHDRKRPFLCLSRRRLPTCRCRRCRTAAGRRRTPRVLGRAVERGGAPPATTAHPSSEIRTRHRRLARVLDALGGAVRARTRLVVETHERSLLSTSGKNLGSGVVLSPAARTSRRLSAPPKNARREAQGRGVRGASLCPTRNWASGSLRGDQVRDQRPRTG